MVQAGIAGDDVGDVIMRHPSVLAYSLAHKLRPALAALQAR